MTATAAPYIRAVPQWVKGKELLLAAAAMALAFVPADRLTGRRLVSWVISLGVGLPLLRS